MYSHMDPPPLQPFIHIFVPHFPKLRQIILSIMWFLTLVLTIFLILPYINPFSKEQKNLVNSFGSSESFKLSTIFGFLGIFVAFENCEPFGSFAHRLPVKNKKPA